jgi:DNA modification methylase
MKTAPARKTSSSIRSLAKNARSEVEFIVGDSLHALDCLFTRKVYNKAFKADLVLGSPPYPLKGERYNGRFKGTMPPDVWIEWMIPIIESSLNIAPVCAFVVNDSYRDGRFHPAIDGLCWKVYNDLGIPAERPLIWHKNAPPNRKDWFGNDYERIIVFKRNEGPVPIWNWEAIGTPPKYKSGGDFRQRDEKGARTKGGKYPKNPVTRPRDVIRALVGGGLMGSPYAHENEAPYPESLIEPLILALTNPGGLVVDPFCGSGTTNAVAFKHGRNSIGIEARASQIEIARQRIAEISAK